MDSVDGRLADLLVLLFQKKGSIAYFGVRIT